MKLIRLLILSFLILYIICIVIRKIISKYMKNINQVQKFNINTNYLYDDFYENHKAGKGKDLIGNLGIIRYNFMDEIYQYEMEILKLHKDKDYEILNLSLTYCNFDIYLANQLENITIYSIINNLIDYHRCKQKIESLDLSDRIKIFYSKYSDISNIFKEQKFDRIVLLESIGKVKNRFEFCGKIKNLLKNEDSFIYLKTIVFKDLILDEKLNKNIKNELFEKQKYMISFWNYNFGTNQAIVNDLHKSEFTSIKMKSIPIYYLFFTYNIEDILNALKLYFVDLGMGINNLQNWYILFTLNLSHFIIQ